MAEHAVVTVFVEADAPTQVQVTYFDSLGTGSHYWCSTAARSADDPPERVARILDGLAAELARLRSVDRPARVGR